MKEKLLALLLADIGRGYKVEDLQKKLKINKDQLGGLCGEISAAGYPLVFGGEKICLNSLTDVLDLSMLRFMTERAGIETEIVFKPQTGSTNEDAKRLAQKGFTGAVIAERQSMGKGRNGRNFVSEPGGLYLSVVTDAVETEGERLSRYVIAAGVAACKAVNSYGIGAQIKWPNDLYCGRKKLAGILCESVSAGKGTRKVIMGIGFNVNESGFSGELSDIATSVRIESGSRIIRAELAAAVLENIRAGSYDDDMRTYRSLSNTIGRTVKIVSPEGAYEAYAEDINEDGFLIIRRDGQEKILAVGDVSVRL